MFLPGLVVFYILYIVWKLINEWWYNYFKHERLILWGIIMIKGRDGYTIKKNYSKFIVSMVVEWIYLNIYKVIMNRYCVKWFRR